MKKLPAILLALLLLCGACALAEEIDEGIALMDEHPELFESLEDFGQMFYKPAGMDYMDLTAEESANGVYCKLSDGTRTITVSYLAVADAAGNAVSDLDSLAALYAGAGVDSAEILTVNEWPCVQYTVAASNLVARSYLIESGVTLVYTFTPGDDAEMVKSMNSVMEGY